MRERVSKCALGFLKDVTSHVCPAELTANDLKCT